MASVTDIWNMAIGQLAVGDEIGNSDTVTSKEAAACRRYWELVRDQTLRDFPWPRLRVSVTLALITDFTVLTAREWNYSYRMPTDCIRIRRVQNTITRIHTQASVIPYTLGRDAVGDLLYCDLPGAVLEYTYWEQQVGRYTPDMVSAMALGLATMIAPRFGPNAVKLGDRAAKLYEWRRGVAQANAMNETQQDIIDDSSYLSARNP